MIDINLFDTPKTHPFGMCRGYTNASEKEHALAWMLIQIIEVGEWCAIESHYDHGDMVADGLLEEVGERTYKLTTMSIGLLYAHYGKGK